jgi:hypothetical protein
MSNTTDFSSNETPLKAGGYLPDCSTNSGKKKIAVSHTITDVHYTQMIEAYFGTANPVEISISHQTIFNEIGKEIQPGVFPNYLEIHWDTNHDITVVGAAGTPAPGPDFVCYSVCLFQGIDILDSTPDTFVFTQAKDKNDSDTVIFKTLINTNVQHYYDCSNENP